MITLPIENSSAQVRQKTQKENFYAARAALFVLALTAAFALNTTAIAQALPGSLWYNGDWNGVNGAANEENTLVSQANTYDDFNVPAGQTWHVTGVYSVDLLTEGFVATGSLWEIRQGVSNGNAGTIIPGGTGTQTPTIILSPSGGYYVEVTGLNLTLTAGTYFITVAPSDSGSGRSFNTTTSGTNCVGTPCGNNGNSWFNSTFFGVFFGPASAQVGVSPADFSDGVIGTAVPEPATVALITCGVGALLIALRRRREAGTPGGALSH
jgi:hypothetical protein